MTRLRMPPLDHRPSSVRAGTIPEGLQRIQGRAVPLTKSVSFCPKCLAPRLGTKIRWTMMHLGSRWPVPRRRRRFFGTGTYGWSPTTETLTYSVAEAALALGVSAPTAYRLITRRILRPLDCLRHKRIPKRQVHALVSGSGSGRP